jgi:hypothetical protein
LLLNDALKEFNELSLIISWHIIFFLKQCIELLSR